MQCDATVLICTFDRAGFLGATLDSLARSRVSRLRWNVIVVDNNSTDGTRDVVMSRVAGYPVPLTYLFEPRQGKSNALNTGLAATSASIVVFTDDDVQLPEGWVEASCRALLDDRSIDYTGGPVRPIWEATVSALVRSGTRGSLGHARDSRLRRGAVRVRGTASRSARRQHGRPKGARRPRGWLRSRIRAQGRLAPGTGTGGILLPIPRGRRARLVRARHGTPPPRPGGAAHEGVLPSLVVLERRIEGAARAAASDHRARHRSEKRAAARSPASIHAWFSPSRRGAVGRCVVPARRPGADAARGQALLLPWIHSRSTRREKGKQRPSGSQQQKRSSHNASNTLLTPLTTFAPRVSCGTRPQLAPGWHTVDA